jgi:hypothetical protein
VETAEGSSGGIASSELWRWAQYGSSDVVIVPVTSTG